MKRLTSNVLMALTIIFGIIGMICTVQLNIEVSALLWVLSLASFLTAKGIRDSIIRKVYDLK